MVTFQMQEEIIARDDFEEDLTNAAGEEAFEVVDSGEGQSEEGNLIDSVVGKLEEILVDPEFEMERLEFCKKNCDIFEDSEENKLEYTEVFDEYTKMVEKVIEQKLESEIPGFSMSWFTNLLLGSQGEALLLNGDVFDMLLSFTEFSEFKELMLSFKAEKNGLGSCEGTDGTDINMIAVTRMKIFSEEQEDGEERPDLDNMSLKVLHIEKPSTVV